MRALVTLLILLLLYVPVSAGMQQQFALLAKKNTSTGPTYLVSEGAEGTGTPAGWTDTGTVNWDDASAPLDGVQSMSIVANYSYSIVSFSAPATTYGFFAVKLSSLPVSNVTIAILADASNNTLASLRVLSDGSVRIYHGTTYSTSGAVISAGTAAYIWVDYAAGSGANGVANLYVSANTTKGTADATVATGTSTANAGKLRLAKDDASGFTHTFDKVRIDDVNIGDNPQ